MFYSEGGATFNKLLEQGYVIERLKSSVRKFYSRYGDLIKQYEISFISRMLHDILEDDHRQWHLPLIRLTNFWPCYWAGPYIQIWLFIRPSSDGTYYGMVMSIRPGLCPSDSPSVCVSVHPFSTLFSYMFWHIQLKFCTWLSLTVLQIKFECCHFASIFEGVMPLWTQNIGNVQFSALFSYMLWHIELKFCIWLCFNVLQIRFECRHFASILEGVIPLFIRPSSDGMYYGMVMSVRVSVRPSDSVRPTLRPSVHPGLRPPILCTFLLHALTYWAEILHMTLFWCTIDQVRLSSLCVNFWRSYASLWT